MYTCANLHAVAWCSHIYSGTEYYRYTAIGILENCVMRATKSEMAPDSITMVANMGKYFEMETTYLLRLFFPIF